ncbi:MAG TPA: hypothetical protein VK116_03490 [Planctomycetota bacterium]|nr:hypothetical protein [Planctomycetota bacterium]
MATFLEGPKMEQARAVCNGKESGAPPARSRTSPGPATRAARASLWAILAGVATWVGDIERSATPVFAQDEPPAIAVITVLETSLLASDRTIGPALDAFLRGTPDGPDLGDVEAWLERERHRHTGARKPPLRLSVRPPIVVDELPRPPGDGKTSALHRLADAVRLRHRFAELRHQHGIDTVTLFLCVVAESDPASCGRALALPEDGFAVIYTSLEPRVRDRAASVIAHELCHLLGASDKYDDNGRARFPDGYANPRRAPLFPQDHAEIMALARPRGRGESEVAMRLEDCIVGEATARELGWAKNAE